MRTQTISENSNHTAVERCYGFSITEDSAGTASITLRAGASGGKVIVGPINFAASESAIIILPKTVFWEFVGGCYVKEESGSIEGVLYY